MGNLRRGREAKTEIINQRRMSLCMVRPSLGTCWGLELNYRQMSDDKLELCVGKLVPGAPASDILQKGDIIRNINDWDVGRFHQPQVAAHLFCAAGNTVKLDIDRDRDHHNTDSANWAPLITL